MVDMWNLSLACTRVLSSMPVLRVPAVRVSMDNGSRWNDGHPAGLHDFMHQGDLIQAGGALYCVRQEAGKFLLDAKDGIWYRQVSQSGLCQHSIQSCSHSALPFITEAAVLPFSGTGMHPPGAYTCRRVGCHSRHSSWYDGAACLVSPNVVYCRESKRAGLLPSSVAPLCVESNVLARYGQTG